MKYKIFGRNSGLRVSEVALGAANFGILDGNGLNPEQAKSIFEKYLSLGGNFIDTSETYKAGQSEAIIGELINADRDRLVISSKYTRGVTTKEGISAIGNSRKSMVRAIEGTLRRLKTDHVDIYWVHAEDRLTPMEEILRAFDDLSRDGKILYAGISNFPAWKISRGVTIAEAKNSTPIIGVQLEYNLVERSADRELLPMAEGLGLGVMIYSPLAHGKLSKIVKSSESMAAGRVTEMKDQTARIRDEVFLISEELRCSPSQVAIAWSYAKARASTTALIPVLGASRPEQLEDNVKALLISLSAEQLAKIERVSQIDLGNPQTVVTQYLPMFRGGALDAIIEPFVPNA
jgi:aryl-alcohol dehydrogenase-like predicted oxidoreductase